MEVYTGQESRDPATPNHVDEKKKNAVVGEVKSSEVATMQSSELNISAPAKAEETQAASGLWPPSPCSPPFRVVVSLKPALENEPQIHSKVAAILKARLKASGGSAEA